MGDAVEQPGGPAIAPFVLRPDYTDAELDTLRAAEREWAGGDSFLAVALGGAALALAGALVAEALGAATPRNGVVFVFLYGAFGAGYAAERLVRTVERWRRQAALRAEQRADLAGLTLRVSPRGVAARRGWSVLALPWHAVQHGKWVGGLVVLHAPGGVRLGLPDRLMTAEQRTAVLDRVAADDDW